MIVALLLFPELTQLDLTGPYEVLSRCPDTRVHLVAKSREPVRTEHGMTLMPTASFADLPRADVLCVPGGFGVNALLNDAATLAYVRAVAVSARFVTSVCTGALVLGAAGLLKGRRATTHWTAIEFLPAFGALPTRGRVVGDGNLMTGGGVTAGIDFALTLAAALHGDEVAQGIQLAMEYNPAPPFHAGHPDTAPGALVERIRRTLVPRQQERRRLVEQAAAALT